MTTDGVSSVLSVDDDTDGVQNEALQYAAVDWVVRRCSAQVLLNGWRLDALIYQKA